MNFAKFLRALFYGTPPDYCIWQKQCVKIQREQTDPKIKYISLKECVKTICFVLKSIHAVLNPEMQETKETVFMGGSL